MKCSFLEIYNETITDLLRPSSGNLNLREDMKRGCYVDILTEEIVLNGMHCRTAAPSFTVVKWAYACISKCMGMKMTRPGGGGPDQ